MSEQTEKPVDVPSSFDLTISPAQLLHRAQQYSGDLHAQTFGANGLTQRQTTVLAALGGSDGLSQTQLVHATGIDRSTLAEMVARMEAKNYVVREKLATDARVNNVKLSDLGRETLVDVLPKLAAIDGAILSLLSADGGRQLLKGLGKIAFPNATLPAGLGGKAKKKKDKKKKVKKNKTERAPD